MFKDALFSVFLHILVFIILALYNLFAYKTIIIQQVNVALISSSVLKQQQYQSLDTSQQSKKQSKLQPKPQPKAKEDKQKVDIPSPPKPPKESLANKQDKANSNDLQKSNNQFAQQHINNKTNEKTKKLSLPDPMAKNQKSQVAKMLSDVETKPKSNDKVNKDNTNEKAGTNKTEEANKTKDTIQKPIASTKEESIAKSTLPISEKKLTAPNSLSPEKQKQLLQQKQNFLNKLQQKPLEAPQQEQRTLAEKSQTKQNFVNAILAGNADDSLSKQELKALNDQLKGCWYGQTGHAAKANLIVRLILIMNPDATIQSIQVQDQDTFNNPLRKAVLNQVLRALRNPKCNQLRLPIGKYNSWKVIHMTFQPMQY